VCTIRAGFQEKLKFLARTSDHGSDVHVSSGACFNGSITKILSMQPYMHACRLQIMAVAMALTAIMTQQAISVRRAAEPHKKDG